MRCPAAAHCTTEKDVSPCLHVSSIKSERLQINLSRPPRVLQLTTWVNPSNRIPRSLVVSVFELIWTFSKHGAASLLNSFERRLEILNHFRANRVSQQSSFQLSSIGPCYHVHMRELFDAASLRCSFKLKAVWAFPASAAQRCAHLQLQQLQHNLLVRVRLNSGAVFLRYLWHQRVACARQCSKQLSPFVETVLTTALARQLST